MNARPVRDCRLSTIEKMRTSLEQQMISLSDTEIESGKIANKPGKDQDDYKQDEKETQNSGTDLMLTQE